MYYSVSLVTCNRHIYVIFFEHYYTKSWVTSFLFFSYQGETNIDKNISCVSIDRLKGKGCKFY